MVFWLKQFAANGSIRDSDPVGLSGGSDNWAFR